MFKRKHSSDEGENSGQNGPKENPSCEVSLGDKLGIQPAKRLKRKDDLPPVADAGFSITEPTYDFKFLDSPCTVTSRSALAPVSEEDREVICSVTSCLSENTNKTTSTSMELSSDSDQKNSLPGIVRHCLSSGADSDDFPNNATPSSSRKTILPPHHHRQLRKKRKMFAFTSEECPVCGITVRRQDIKEHFKCELRQLDYLKKKLKKPQKVSYVNKKLEQVKANRAKRSCPTGSRQMKDVSVSTCMICHPELMDDDAAVHTRAMLHLSDCVGGRELLEEGLNEQPHDEQYRGILAFVDHVDSMSYNRIENVEDEDSPVHVSVDSDEDDVIYGSPQFSEQNLVVSSSSLSDSGLSALREAFLSSSDDDIPLRLEVPSPNIQNEATTACEFLEGSDCDETETRKHQEENQHSTSSAVIDALRSRVLELEEQLQTRSASKCNICLENYKNPLVSVICWHVSCEECWMKTLGAKKLCAQCAKITLPINLRRIYL